MPSTETLVKADQLKHGVSWPSFPQTRLMCAWNTWAAHLCAPVGLCGASQLLKIGSCGDLTERVGMS